MGFCAGLEALVDPQRQGMIEGVEDGGSTDEKTS